MALMLAACGEDAPAVTTREPRPPQPPTPAALPDDEPTRAPPTGVCAAPIPVYEDGATARSICPDEARAAGLTVLELGDDWAPRLFTEDPSLGEAGHQPYRATFVALANEEDSALPRRQRGERYLELFGIPPSFRVLRARLGDVERHACHDAVDDEAIGRYEIALRSWSVPQDEQRRDLRLVRFLDAALERERVARGLPDIASLAGVTRRPRALADWRRLHARIDAVRAMQAHLVCDGLLSRHDAGVFDGWTGAALARLQQRAVIVSSGTLDAPTRARLREDSRETDFLAVLRALRERVVDASGLIEDGSARAEWGTVLGRVLDPPEMRATAGRPPIERGAPDLVSPATEAAARALGWDTTEGFLAFFGTERVPGRAAVRLPPSPEYHRAHIELRAEIDRGDVWYEYPYTAEGVRRSLPVQRRPILVLYAATEDGEIALVRWPTTIGGWKPERAADGTLGLRYKESPPGERIWQDVIAGPSWLPPPSTPDDELVRRGPNGWQLDLDIVGPGHRSAYGLAMMPNLWPMTRRGEPLLDENGQQVIFDQGVRVHGSVSYRSILSGTSHGCHRLYNHLAVRLADFLLAHRRHVRHGQLPMPYARQITMDGRTETLRIHSRGYRYELTPPVIVRVLEGRVRGVVHEAPSALRPLPESLAAAAAAAAAADEGM